MSVVTESRQYQGGFFIYLFQKIGKFVVFASRYLALLLVFFFASGFSCCATLCVVPLSCPALAAGCIELAVGKPLAETTTYLQEAVACLGRGMQWCPPRRSTGAQLPPTGFMVLGPPLEIAFSRSSGSPLGILCCRKSRFLMRLSVPQYTRAPFEFDWCTVTVAQMQQMNTSIWTQRIVQVNFYRLICAIVQMHQ